MCVCVCVCVFACECVYVHVPTWSCTYNVPHICREAWHSLGAMTKEEAVRQYLELVSAIAPAWESHSSSKPQQLVSITPRT